MVRQSYPFKTSGLQECEQTRGMANKETSRLINQDGTVMKFMQNGTVIVSTQNMCLGVLDSVPELEFHITELQYETCCKSVISTYICAPIITLNINRGP